MHVVHVTAHLGGGVGKAHAALRAAMTAEIRQTYLLLEPPRDRRYADEIVAHGGEIVFADDFDDVIGYCAAADIVQFEFWNHPKLFECLARADLPPLRSVFWSHVSGLFRPVIAPGFFSAADRFVFTTPASLVLGEGHNESRLSAIGSGFGFADLPVGLVAPPSILPNPITYLGTVDFIKFHPGFFDAIDALSHDATAAIWGTHDPHGEVAARAAAMRHPERIRFMGQTADPRSALARSRILFYPLQPDHYGTAENALIEAMSLGLVPVVLDNPAERAIVTHGLTGFIGQTIADCTAILDRLLADPGEVTRIGTNAARTARADYTPEHSARAFTALWSSLAEQPKHTHDFRAIMGSTPLDWYRTTQATGSQDICATDVSTQQSKGTLAHFRSAFPDDPCWSKL